MDDAKSTSLKDPATRRPGTLYLRRRIPPDFFRATRLAAEIWVSLRTTNIKQAKVTRMRSRGPLGGEFLQRRLRLASEANLLPFRQAFSSLSEEQIAFGGLEAAAGALLRRWQMYALAGSCLFPGR